MVIPDGGKCLDVGCGSGALSNAVAKKNPCAQAFRRLRQTIMRVNLGLQ